MYHGKNITVINNRVIIDGKDVTPDQKEITIIVEGDLENLAVDSCESVNIKGSVYGDVKTMSGGLKVEGNISGNVKTMSGDIKCKGEIHGSINTMSGDIKR